MTGQWKAEFNKVARNGITNYAKAHNRHTDDIGIMMVLDRRQDAQFLITVGPGKNPMMQPVKFLNILHKPDTKFDVTGKSYLIPKFIGKELKRLAEKFQIDPVIFNVQVKMKENEIYLFVMNGTGLVKLLDDDEVFDDDQVTMALMEEVK